MDNLTLLVVFDPTSEEQPALVRAGELYSGNGARIHLFAAIHGELDPALNQTEQIAERVAAERRRMEEVAYSLLPKEAELYTEIEWDADWYNSVVRASRRVQPDGLFKASFSHSVRERSRKTSDWTFVRECQCPVLLVKGGPEREPRILAAVDMQSPKSSYQAMNQEIISFARDVLDVGAAEVHFVNAYRDARLAPNREEMMELTGVDAEHIHIHRGDVETVIVQKAEMLEASLVVIGHSARVGLKAALAGNTVEKVLDQVDCDVLSIPKPE